MRSEKSVPGRKTQDDESDGRSFGTAVTCRESRLGTIDGELHYTEPCDGTLLGVTSPLRRRSANGFDCGALLASAIMTCFFRTELSLPVIMMTTTRRLVAYSR